MGATLTIINRQLGCAVVKVSIPVFFIKDDEIIETNAIQNRVVEVEDLITTIRFTTVAAALSVVVIVRFDEDRTQVRRWSARRRGVAVT